MAIGEDMIGLTKDENPYTKAKLVDASRRMYCLSNGICIEQISLKMTQQAFREGAKAQLKKVMEIGRGLIKGEWIDTTGMMDFWQALSDEVK